MNITSEEIRAKILNYCNCRQDIVEVWFFGSRFKGEYRPNSDLDLFIECDANSIDLAKWSVLKDIKTEHNRLKQDLQHLFPFPLHAIYCHTKLYDDELRASAYSGIMIYQKSGWDQKSNSLKFIERKLGEQTQL